jgi:hypothetical protein
MLKSGSQRVVKKGVLHKCSVADPDPEGSETFGRIRIRSGTEINVSDPDSNPVPKLHPKKICKK